MNKKIIKPILALSLAMTVIIAPEVLAKTAAKKVDGLDDIFNWVQNMMQYGVIVIGSGAFLNFMYQLVSVQNLRAAGISGACAALAGGVGTKLVTSMVI